MFALLRDDGTLEETNELIGRLKRRVQRLHVIVNRWHGVLGTRLLVKGTGVAAGGVGCVAHTNGGSSLQIRKAWLVFRQLFNHVFDELAMARLVQRFAKDALGSINSQVGHFSPQVVQRTLLLPRNFFLRLVA